MAKYDFTKFRANTDAEKVSPRLEHEFRPVKEDADIVVRCSYLKAGERSGFIDITGDGSASYNWRRIFARKVEAIRGLILTVTDEKTGKPKDIGVEDAATLLEFPDEGVVNDIVVNTARHLVNGDSLTETEEGN